MVRTKCSGQAFQGEKQAAERVAVRILNGTNLYSGFILPVGIRAKSRRNPVFDDGHGSMMPDGVRGGGAR